MAEAVFIIIVSVIAIVIGSVIHDGIVRMLKKRHRRHPEDR